MGERYFISGVQLRMIQALNKHDPVRVKNIVDVIIEKQHIGNTHDLKVLQKQIKKVKK